MHLGPTTPPSDGYRTWAVDAGETGLTNARTPFLRRAFSIADLADAAGGVNLDVIYRVVGAATRWMESLAPGDSLSCMGPLGNAFQIHAHKPVAWLVAGGVGLPPMLWLAQALHRAGKHVVAFCGAYSAELLALTLDPTEPPSRDGRQATPSALEFSRHEVPVVISSDDGSIGFAGRIGEALCAFASANPISPHDVVVYTCGPEGMMRYVADYCLNLRIECYVCMERAMACGSGMCQSCVVPVHDEDYPEGWRYQLCCTDGPIFDARRIIWQPVGTS